VIGLTKSLGKELAGTGIRVNCMTPAAARNDIFAQTTEAQIDHHAVEDPDGPLPARRRDRSAGRLAVFRGVLVLDRRRIRHFRRQGDLSGSERPLDRRGALGEPAHSHPITRRDGLLRRHP
jgi:NAD(P)-dependent dehydrogenase (short-subunit alcohol dehydrogenase family)